MKTLSRRRQTTTRAVRKAGSDTPAPAYLSLNIFQDLRESELAAITDALESVAFEDGDIMLHQGASGDHMFLLEYGTVRITVDGPDGLVFDRTVNAPAALGEMAMVTDEPRTATVTAVENVRCLRLARARMDAVVGERPEVAKVLTRLVGERLREIDGIRRVGKYLVTGVLGDGGVARVFAAEHPDLGSPVALKMLSHSLAFHPQFSEAFDNEARIIAALNHPNVLRVYDTEQAYGTRFIVMEQLDGYSLERELDNAPRMSWARISSVLQDVLWALQHLHEHGLVHRDVKPENIFLLKDGTIKLIDFGIAIAMGRSELPLEERLGTPPYMSPEQIMGEALDGRADLYSLGLTAYEMATQRLAFDAEDMRDILQMQLDDPTPDPRRRVHGVPDWLVEFIERSTAKDPNDRFADCAAAAEFLSAAPPGLMSARFEFPPEVAQFVQARLRRLAEDFAKEGLNVDYIE